MFLHVTWETRQTQTCVRAIQMVTLKCCFPAHSDGKEAIMKWTQTCWCLQLQCWSKASNCKFRWIRQWVLSPSCGICGQIKNFSTLKRLSSFSDFLIYFWKAGFMCCEVGVGKRTPDQSGLAASVQDFTCFCVHSLDRRRSGAAPKPSQSCFADEVSNGQEATGSDRFFGKALFTCSA